MSTKTRKEILNMDDQMIGSFIMMAIFIGFTAYMINFINTNTTMLSDSKFGSVIYQLLLGAAFLVLLALFANYKALDFLQDHAYGIIKWSYLITFVAIIGAFAIFGLFMLPSIVGIVLLALAGLFLLFTIWIWPSLKARIELAAEWLTMSATIVLNEPGMIVLSFIQSIVIGIAGLTGTFSIYAWNQYADASNISQNNSDLVVYGITFLYLWITLFVIYYFDGANTYIAYSRLKGHDPKVGQGINSATHKILSLLFYALISAIVWVIVNFIYSWAKQARRSARSGKGNNSMAVLAIFAQIFAGVVEIVYHLVSFFTLPSIIVRQNGLPNAMSESYHLFRNTFWDVIISDTGYSFGSIIMYFVVAVILSIGGFAYGYFVGGQLFWGFVVAILGLILGLLMTKFFLRPLYTSLVTTIYVYASEGPNSMKIVPKKLANHLTSELKQPRVMRN